MTTLISLSVIIMAIYILSVITEEFFCQTSEFLQCAENEYPAPI